MDNQQLINYQRIETAITYIRENFRQQPSLEELASKMNMSPFHFQRMFTDWTGVSPKKFLQYTSLEYAKSLLREKQANLFDAAADTGLSGTGRLHDLFIRIEGMTPGEYKNGGEDLKINYEFSATPFGEVLIASTGKGVCHMAFITDREAALNDLKMRFPNARFTHGQEPMHALALNVFRNEPPPGKISLHLKGSPFQIKVWESLLKIPAGSLRSYGSIAAGLSNPNASRAVGTAIGSNPVAFLIPCHRVIQSGGAPGGYMWGLSRKSIMIGWEAAALDSARVEQGAKSKE